MSEARKNRGMGNGGKAYVESPFWDSIKKDKCKNCKKCKKTDKKVGE